MGGNNSKNEEQIRTNERQRNRIENLERENKQQKEFLEKQLNDYKEEMKKMREQQEKAQKESELRYKEMMEEQRKRDMEMQEKIQKAKDEKEKRKLEEERKREEERKKKEEEIYNKFEKEKESIIIKEMEIIVDEFNDNSNDFCVKEIENYDKDKITKLVESFIDTENIKSVLMEKVKLQVDDYNKTKGEQSIKHLNIILVGPSGVGKSTLINSVLELDENKGAPTGIGEPCTQGDPQFYDSIKVNFIRVADSKGIEKGSYGVDAVVESTKNFIEKQLLTKDPDKYIHCIWYCITGARFEDVEKESLQKLADIYNNSELPIIVVYTKAIMKSLYEPIERKIRDLKKDLEFVPVISKEIEIEESDEDENEDEGEEDNNNKKKKKKLLKKKGIKKLMNLSVQKAEQAVASACFTAIKNNILEDIKKNNDVQNTKLEQFIKTQNIKKINKFKSGMNINEMVESISGLIFDVISKYLYSENKNLNKDSTDKIEYFLFEFFEYNLREYRKIFKIYIEGKSELISSKLLELQNKTINKNEKLKIIKSKEEFEIDIKGRLSERLMAKAELYCLKNSASFISEPIREKFSKLILSLFNKTLDTDEIAQILTESAAHMFKKLQLIINDKNKQTNKREEKR